MSTAGPDSAADRALRHIRRALLTGTYPPGTMLSESALAADLGLSRTPVRAALRRLQDEGLLTIYPKRGALVRELSADEVRASAQARHALETAGVRFAEAAARTALRAELAPNLAEQERALDGGDFPAFARAAMAFHRSFVTLAGNAVMLDLYDRLQDRQMLSILRSTPSITDQPCQVLDAHRALLDDAEAGDWVSFADRLTTHQEDSHALP
ncbi:MAG: GntR family transcriptional regulator [Gordonia sp. (in: high G+C Gram-positive bacteria)]|uniref:GntR family transcriptional regulator n=1 Tax=Gordonia sp. (in: high G+C Gram-positive bacteria) TaxID=84139 RepID=UPI0039E2940E